MSRGFVPRRCRFQAQQFRLTAKKMRFKEVRHELEVLARLYEELADYIEAKPPIKKQSGDAPGDDG
jgi:hypothetical protein